MRRTSLLTVAAGLAMLCGTSLAGGLNPPVGPVEPTMLPLDAIEPRTPLSTLAGAADAVHVITAPGHYFATADIVAPPGKNGIVIDLPPGTGGMVVIDLSGMAIVGEIDSRKGITIRGTGFGNNPDNLCCRSGAIMGMGEDGIDAVCASGEFTDLKCEGNGGSGLKVRKGGNIKGNVTINNSNFRSNGSGSTGGDGIRVQPFGMPSPGHTTLRIVNSDVSGNAGHGCSITNQDEGSAHIVVRATIFADNTLDGMRYRSGTRVFCGVADRTAFRGNGGSGCDVECDSGEFHDFTCSDNGASGLKIKNMGNIKGNINVISANLVSNGSGPAGGDGCSIENIAHIQARDLYSNSNAGAGLRITAGNAFGLPSPGHTTLVLRDSGTSGNTGDGITVVRSNPTNGITCDLKHIVSSQNRDDGFDGDCDTFRSVEVACDDNLASGFKVKNMGVITGVVTVNNGSACRNGGDGLDLDSDSVELTGCTTNDNARNGGTVKGNVSVISANRSSGNGECGLKAQGGIKKWVTELYVERNGFSGPANFPGLLLEGVSGFSLEEIESSGNAGSGVTVTGAFSNGSVTNSRCCANGGAGVHLPAAGGVAGGRFVAVGNFADGNTNDGIFLESTTGGEVRDCTLSNNGGAGLSILGFGHVVRSNTCISNGVGAFLINVPGNSVGPLVDEGNIATECSAAANFVR